MRRAPEIALICSALCVLLVACDARPTLDDARREAALAEALLKKAMNLGAQGQSTEANAQAMSAQDRMTTARDLYLSARADRSTDATVLVEFAVLCERLRDYDLAGEAYLRAAEQLPEDPAGVTLWYSAAKNFVAAEGRYLTRAAESLDHAEKLMRGGATGVSSTDIEITRGDISWKNGAYELAAKRYADALAADPANLRAKMLSACSAVALGNFAPAEKIMEELQSQGALIGEGSAFDARFREAYAAYRRMRPAIPNTAAAYRALAGISIRAGFLDDGRTAVEHALTLDDRDVYLWNMAGSLAHRAGDIDRARAAFTRSLELEPNQPRTRDSLAQLSSVESVQKP